MWKSRGLYTDDLESMNEREAEKYVKKDNIWKKPDYQAMIDEGIPLGVVYYIKKVRDCLPASPRYPYGDNTTEKRLARQKEYIETVRQLEAVMKDVRTVEDAMKACDRFMVGNGYLSRVPIMGGSARYMVEKKGRDNPSVTDKLFTTLHIRSTDQFEWHFTKKAQSEQFGVPKERKVPRGYSIRYYDGENGYSRSGEWKPDTYYVTKGYQILKNNLATWDEALHWAQEKAKDRGRGGKKRFVPEQLSGVRRNGPDYRNGQDITGKDYLDTFGFRGGEFGNWMNQNDRQASLNMGFEALKDLASALKISDRDISYQGTLSIAFGARGSGNAAAHYEPLRKVINLTKMHGAGSLAHEWWHGLDDYLGVKMGAGEMLSEKPGSHPLFSKLESVMKYKLESPEQAQERAEQEMCRAKKNAERVLDDAVSSSLDQNGNKTQREQYTELKAAFLSGQPGTVEKINDLKKEVSGRMIPKTDRGMLEAYERILHGMSEQKTVKPRQIKTDYYQNSIRMGKEYGKDGGYWDCNAEMSARAFACYIKDKLPYRSDYLVGHAESAVAFSSGENGHLDIIKAYPEGEERRAINAVFDEIVAELKLQNILTHEEKTQPLDISGIREASDGQLSMFGTERSSVLDRLEAGKSAKIKSEYMAAVKKTEPEL